MAFLVIFLLTIRMVEDICTLLYSPPSSSPPVLPGNQPSFPEKSPAELDRPVRPHRGYTNGIPLIRWRQPTFDHRPFTGSSILQSPNRKKRAQGPRVRFTSQARWKFFDESAPACHVPPGWCSAYDGPLPRPIQGQQQRQKAQRNEFGFDDGPAAQFRAEAEEAEVAAIGDEAARQLQQEALAGRLPALPIDPPVEYIPARPPSIPKVGGLLGSLSLEDDANVGQPMEGIEYASPVVLESFHVYEIPSPVRLHGALGSTPRLLPGPRFA